MDVSLLLATVRPLASLGQRLLGPAWERFLDEFLRSAASASGRPPRRAGEFLLFELPAGAAQVVALRSAVETAKTAAGWTPYTGPAPLQLVLGRRGPGDVAAKAWELLRPGEFYLSSELKATWRSVLGRGELACTRPGREVLGLTELRWADSPPATELLPFAAAPLLGEGAECFCCGRYGHGAAQCPSKHLSPDVHGLSALAQYPLGAFGEAHLESLLNEETFFTRCAGGLTGQEVRASLALALFAGAFDATRLYQLRFLIHFGFGSEERWPGIRAPRREGTSSRSHLFLALDCLRVGRRAEAVKLFTEKAKIGTGSQYYAALGLAFAALEEGGPRAMVPELNRAGRLATGREEHVYRLLLLSRASEVLGDLEGAARHAEEAVTYLPGCPEVRYRNAQLALRFGLAEKALSTVRELAEGDEDYFHLALLDPHLLPLRQPLDEALSTLYEAAARSAEDSLSTAGAECEALRIWFDGEDPELAANLSTLASFRQTSETRGYGVLRQVAARAAGLVVACRSLKEKRLRQATEELSRRQTLWRRFDDLWRAYPYKRFCRNFSEALRAAEAEVTRAKRLVGAGPPGSHRELRDLLKTVEEKVGALATLGEELRWVARALGFARRFSRRLLLLEMFLVPLWLVSMAAVEWALAQESLAPMVRGAAAQQWARSGGLAFCLLVAPLLALMAPESSQN